MWLIAIAAAFSLHASATPAHAEAYLLIDANSGKVLQAENATQPWYPASLTKIMTAYVTLTAVKPWSPTCAAVWRALPRERRFATGRLALHQG